MAFSYLSQVYRRWFPASSLSTETSHNTSGPNTLPVVISRLNHSSDTSPAPKEGKFWKGFDSVFTLDLRSLSLMRVAVALVLMTDLIIRYSDLRGFFVDAGVLPMEVLFRYLWNPAYFSVYTMASSWPLQSVVFAANLGCVICLLAGYRTRLFSVLCWVFLLSIHNRNPLVHQGGDDLLRLLLFWGIFLPWGYHYSVDSRRYDKSVLPSNQYLSLAGFVYVCHIFYVYFFSALLKSSPEWNGEFTALYYALSFEQIVTPFGQYIYPFGDFLKFMTMLTFYTELVLPFLLFVPFITAYCRLAFILIICLLHLGISLTLYVGLFPLISIASVIGLAPVLLHERFPPKGRAMVQRARSVFSRLADRWAARAFGNGNPDLNRIKKLAYIPRERPVVSALMLFFLAYTVLWNVETTGRSVAVLRPLHWVGNFLRIDQHWGMFAPAVFKDDGWFLLLGRTVNGKEVDIAHPGEPVSYEKPAVMPAFYKNDRWRKFHENMLMAHNDHFRLYYCAYLTNRWNNQQTSPGNRIPNLKIIYVKEVSLPDYKVAPPLREVLCECNTVLEKEEK
jgi:hypothetical protein